MYLSKIIASKRQRQGEKTVVVIQTIINSELGVLLGLQSSRVHCGVQLIIWFL